MAEKRIITSVDIREFYPQLSPNVAEEKIETEGKGKVITAVKKKRKEDE